MMRAGARRRIARDRFPRFTTRRDGGRIERLRAVTGEGGCNTRKIRSIPPVASKPEISYVSLLPT